MSKKAVSTKHQQETQAYDKFLQRKIKAARVSMRDGLGRSNHEVEAQFAARRARTSF
jgi:hypothetical protein